MIETVTELQISQSYHKQIACKCQTDLIQLQTYERDSCLAPPFYCFIIIWRQQLTEWSQIQRNHFSAAVSNHCFPRVAVALASVHSEC